MVIDAEKLGDLKLWERVAEIAEAAATSMADRRESMENRGVKQLTSWDEIAGLTVVPEGVATNPGCEDEVVIAFTNGAFIVFSAKSNWEDPPCIQIAMSAPDPCPQLVKLGIYTEEEHEAWTAARKASWRTRDLAQLARLKAKYEAEPGA